METKEKTNDTKFSIEVEDTKNRCPIGETVGNRNIAEGKIPVLSCEGACIRGEIARLAANMIAKEIIKSIIPTTMEVLGIIIRGK